MKFSWKIFIYTYMIMVVSFGIGGFLIIETSFENNIRFRQDGLVESNQYLADSYITMIIVDSRLESNMAENYRNNVVREDKNSRVFIGTAPEMTNYDSKLFHSQVRAGKRMIRVTYIDGDPFLQVVCAANISSDGLFFIENLENISDIYKAREANYRQFQMILLTISTISGILLLMIAGHLTKPLKRLSQAAKEIGNGSFDKRVKLKKKGSIEIRSLTEDFNRMASYVESYIEELTEENRRREEFIGNFTHELKTPLTSVIGYADLLRSYDVDFEKRRQYAEYIYHEGTRMEALALNLLDLIVLKKQEFDLKPENIKYIFTEVEKTLVFVTKKYHAKLHMEYEACMVMMEKNLLTTLMYNLVDNACKAVADNVKKKKATDIYIMGCVCQEGYRITVKDTGIGIEEEEIHKITEAFYMVDKSRARTMGGAGLGLALCLEIARIHGSSLEIESELGKGTEVSLILNIGGETT